jgi:phytoene synthase
VRQACAGGAPQLPVIRELQPFICKHNLRYDFFDDLLRGVEMDLEIVRYPTYAELELYCYRVASVVGLLSIEIFGYKNPGCRDYAVHLGKALQLTNILRDVWEDAQRGRIYLPAEDLDRFGYTAQELCQGVYNEAFVQLMAFEAERARDYYRRAVTAFSSEDRRSLAAAEAMRLIYRRLLDKLAARRFQVFDKRVTLPTMDKIGLAFFAWARGRLLP